MPSFILPDPYDGWPVERLKERCRDLCRAVDTWQHIAMTLVEGGKLHPESQAKVDHLIEAYKD